MFNRTSQSSALYFYKESTYIFFYSFETENRCTLLLCFIMCSVPPLLISWFQDKHITSYNPFLHSRSSSKAGQVWAPEGSTAFKCLVSARLCAALLSNISDCDETYNYWEPVSYIFSWFTHNFLYVAAALIWKK